MKPNSLLILGCGDIGVRVAGLLEGTGMAITGACRNPQSLPDTLNGIEVDYHNASSLECLEALAPDYLLLTLKPSGMSETGYRQGFPQTMARVLDGLGSHRPALVIMVSSTRVYAEASGGWVDETSRLSSSGYAAPAIVAAENLLMQSAHNSCIVRFAGIYGNPEGRLLERIGRGEVCAAEPVRYSNRIHRDDCAGFLVHLLGMDATALAPVYTGVDDAPTPQYEVEQWLADQMGVEHRVPSAARRQTAGHKRCKNDRLRASGYNLLYPGYRSGYRAVLDQRLS